MTDDADAWDRRWRSFNGRAFAEAVAHESWLLSLTTDPAEDAEQAPIALRTRERRSEVQARARLRDAQEARSQSVREALEYARRVRTDPAEWRRALEVMDTGQLVDLIRLAREM